MKIEEGITYDVLNYKRICPYVRGGSRGGGGPGGPGPPLSENLGIDFYSGFRKKSRYTLLYQRKKTQGGGGAIVSRHRLL